VPDHSDFDTGDAITVACWFNTTDSLHLRTILAHDSSDYKYMLSITWRSAELLFSIKQPSGISDASTGNLGIGHFSDGNWHLLVGTFDRSLSTDRLKLYVDGQFAGSVDAFDENILPGDEGIEIGKLGTIAEFTGQLDDARIYNRALSASEIEQLYLDAQ